MTPVRRVLIAVVCGIPATPMRGVRMEDGTDRTLFCTIRTSAAGLRRACERRAGEALCPPDPGAVKVEEGASGRGIEGYPGMSGPSRRDTRLVLQAADSCRWTTHGR